MATPPPAEAVLSLTAELANGMWTILYYPPTGNRQALGGGTTGTGILIPTKLLDNLKVAQES